MLLGDHRIPGEESRGLRLPRNRRAVVAGYAVGVGLGQLLLQALGVVRWDLKNQKLEFPTVYVSCSRSANRMLTFFGMKAREEYSLNHDNTQLARRRIASTSRRALRTISSLAT
jgi:hypothetical protein